MEFVKYPSIARLCREWKVTEKLDGTNAQIAILGPDDNVGLDLSTALAVDGSCDLLMWVGSRHRWLAPGKQNDNFGFASWCLDHADELFTLGVGKHYGEWWGQGIQRGYGLDEKRFTLFHAPRDGVIPECVSGVVPQIAVTDIGDVTARIDHQPMPFLVGGSIAAPGYMNPEGIVITHTPSRTNFKYTFDGDGHKTTKGQQ